MDFDAQLKAFAQRVLNQDSDSDIGSTTEISEIPSSVPEKEVVLYQTDNGNINVSVFYYDETFWLTQKAMGDLFDTSKQSISYHLNNIFSDGELNKNSVVKEFLTTAVDGKNYRTQFYEYDTLNNLGTVSRKVADDLAIAEYNKYRILQDTNYKSDFDLLFDEFAGKYL